MTGLVLTGCGQSRPDSVVYVDLPSLLQAAPTVKPGATPSPPSGIPGQSLTLPALPARSIRDQSRPQIEAAAESLSADRRAAYRTLLARLTNEAQDRIQREEALRLEQLQPQRAQIDAEETAKRRVLFDAYAAKRGPLLIRENELAATAAGTYRMRGTSVADLKEVRAQIAALDAQFNKEVSGLDAEAQRRYDAAVTAVKAETSRLITEAQAQAQKDARQQIGQVSAEIKTKTLGDLDRTLPATPAKSATLPATAGPAAAPKPQFQSPLSSQQDRMALLQQRVEIWARTSGYRLSSNPKDGRDATSEFRTWMNARTFGP